MSTSPRCVSRRTALLGLAASLALAAAGCAPDDLADDAGGDLGPSSATELTKGMAPAADAPDCPPPISVLSDETARLAAFDFAARLLRQARDAQGEGENTLVSPVSVERCLAMVQNGAAGETLSQMEAAFGLSRDELNSYLHAYHRRLCGDLYGTAAPGEGTAVPPVSIAESVWVRADPSPGVREEFLQANVDLFEAPAFEAPFDDGTVSDVNAWVSDATDGMIDGIVDGLPSEARVLLVSALALDARWQTPYEDAQVSDATFTREDGAAEKVELMSSREGIYLEGERATGFFRFYEGAELAFVGLLPREGVTVSELVGSLDGAGLLALLAPVGGCVVDASVPKFELEYEASLVESLMALGMTDVFDPLAADLSLMAEEALFVSDVRHKTYVSVSETGTRAAAATSAAVDTTSAAPSEEPEVRSVVLDRPFVYLIVDYQTMTPLFAGTVESLG